jgi:hypothetical protein
MSVSSHSYVLAASVIKTMIVLIMEAANTSETSVKFNRTTRRSNREDSYLLVCLPVHKAFNVRNQTTKRIIVSYKREDKRF